MPRRNSPQSSFQPNGGNNRIRISQERRPLWTNGGSVPNYSSTSAGEYHGANEGNANPYRDCRQALQSEDLPQYVEVVEDSEVSVLQDASSQPSPAWVDVAQRVKETGTPKSDRGGLRLIGVFLLGALVAWVLQDVWAMGNLDPLATEKRKIAWDKEYAKHAAEVTRMNEITERWTEEIKQHDSARRAMRTEREEWNKERALWMAESLEREKLRQEERKIEMEQRRRELEKQKDEETREKAGIRWQDPQAGQCLRYGTRKYTAKLENVPDGYNRLKACHETQAWIKGKGLYPSECHDKGIWGGVEGTWVIDYDESFCHTFFQDFKDKGCSAQGSGKRRIESQLQNLQYGADADAMCSSTPADFHGLHFTAPDSCAYWGKYGYWGIWFIDDADCR